MGFHRALVTGGQGFVGSLLAKRLQDQGYQTYSDRFDVSKENEVRKAFAFDPDIVFHLASPTDVESCEKDPNLAFSTIVEGTRNLLAHLGGDRRFIFASSMMVYDEPQEGEHLLDENWKLQPATVYGKAKLEAEALVEEWGKSTPGSNLILRVFPHTHQTQKGSRFLMRTKNRLEALGSGEVLVLDQSLLQQGRDIGAVSDLINLLEVLPKKEFPSGVYNICSGQARRLGVLAQIMAQNLGKKIRFEEKKEGVLNSYCGSFEKISQALAFYPKIKTDEDLIAYYLSICA